MRARLLGDLKHPAVAVVCSNAQSKEATDQGQMATLKSVPGNTAFVAVWCRLESGERPVVRGEAQVEAGVKGAGEGKNRGNTGPSAPRGL